LSACGAAPLKADSLRGGNHNTDVYRACRAVVAKHNASLGPARARITVLQTCNLGNNAPITAVAGTGKIKLVGGIPYIRTTAAYRPVAIDV